MSKVITSPVKRFMGSVTIAEPMTLPQAEAFEEFMRFEYAPSDVDKNGRMTFFTMDKPKLPVIFACVEKWNLENFPEDVTKDNFPHSPTKARHELVDWLYGEIEKVYIGDAEVPNE